MGHPATSLVEKIEKEHAQAIVEFNRKFFHHVYVSPTTGREIRLHKTKDNHHSNKVIALH